MKEKLLTDMAIRHAGPGTHNDGNGLTLRVGKGGSRSWVLRYTFNGRAANVGLGSYPAVGVKEARAKAALCRAEIAEGYRPTGSKEREADVRRVVQETLAQATFREVAERVIELRRPTWTSERHATQWRESLTNHAFPVIGDLPIGDITSRDILNVLTPIWHRLPETATRVKQRVEVILDYAIASNMRQDNPVSAVAKALPPRPRLKRHHPAVDNGEVPAVLERVRCSTADKSTRLAFEFMVLTAARAGEVRNMTWDEIWGDTWTVPAAHMKMRREHRVPLSDSAVTILKEARTLRKEENFIVFPNRRTGKPLSNMAFTRLLERLEVPAVPHGFRSSFKGWTLAETSYPWAVSEAALAHNLGNSMEAAYARTDLFDRRRDLMRDWAAYCEGSQ